MPLENTANLSWNANTDPDFEHYRVYYGMTPQTASQVLFAIVATTFEMTLLITADGVWYFSISAKDVTGNESAKCTPVSKRVIRTSNKLVTRR